MCRIKTVFCFLFLMPVFDAIACYPAMKGTVTEVIDGDGFTFKASTGEILSIRLAEIDAPEKSYRKDGVYQDYALESKQALSDLILGEKVTVTPLTRDVQNRLLSIVSFNGVNINKKMITTGAAWVYEPYVIDTTLAKLQATAKSKGLGLWALPNPIAPWVWKKTN